MQVRNLVEGRWNFEQPRRSKCPPWGIRGGAPGEPSGYLLRLPGERDFKLMVGSHIPVPVGAQAIVRTGGGGGWGAALERDPARVAEDVAQGLVSAGAARKLYGVALKRDMSLDARATKQLRTRQRSSQRASASRGARRKR